MGEVGLRLEELNIASLPWASALRDGSAQRTWSGLATPHLSLRTVSTVTLNTAVKLCSAHSCGVQIKRWTFSQV